MGWSLLGAVVPVETYLFRVGEIGRPTLRIGGRAVRFLEAVGFGGAVVFHATPSPRRPREE